MIPHQPARVAHLLERLARDVAPHVRRLARREERRGADVVEAPLPLPARLGGRVDELEPLPVDGLDGVADPAALDFDARGAVAEEGGAVGAVEVEHVGVAGDGGAEVGELGLGDLAFGVQGWGNFSGSNGNRWVGAHSRRRISTRLGDSDRRRS